MADMYVDTKITSNGSIKDLKCEESKGHFIPTVSQREVAQQFQEPYILTGYRIGHQPWCSYILSIFQVHNECINVWTHMVAFIYMFYKLWIYRDELDFVHDPQTWPLAVGIASSIIMYSTSAAAHCLHSKSVTAHHTCFMLDYTGISLYSFGSGMVHSYFMEDEIYVYLKDIFVPVLFTLALNCCLCCVLSKAMYVKPYPFQRRLCLMLSVLGAYVWAIIPVIYQIWNCHAHGVKCDNSITLHKKQVMYFAVAGFFFGSDIPERFMIGSCDFVGHSHQLFHIAIAIVTVHQMDACLIDLRNDRQILQRRPDPTLLNTFGLLGILLILDLICVAFFRKYMKSKNKLD